MFELHKRNIDSVPHFNSEADFKKGNAVGENIYKRRISDFKRSISKRRGDPVVKYSFRLRSHPHTSFDYQAHYTAPGENFNQNI